MLNDEAKYPWSARGNVLAAGLLRFKDCSHRFCRGVIGTLNVPVFKDSYAESSDTPVVGSAVRGVEAVESGRTRDAEGMAICSGGAFRFRRDIDEDEDIFMMIQLGKSVCD